MKAELLLEVDVSPNAIELTVTRVANIEHATTDPGARELYKGNQLQPVREVILRTVQELAQAQGLAVRPNASGFGDVMKMGDGVGVALGCGHPNTEPGTTCHNCGQIATGAGPH